MRRAELRQNVEVCRLAQASLMSMAAFPADELGKHADSLRALAGDLLADAALADDAVQETCVAALRPPAAVASLGSWLRAMVRGRALDLRRAEARRRQHEQRAARPKAVPAPGTAEQLELQEDILAAVRSQEELARDNVTTGRYQLTLTMAGWHAPPQEVEVRAGQ